MLPKIDRFNQDRRNNVIKVHSNFTLLNKKQAGIKLILEKASFALLLVFALFQYVLI